MIQNPVHIVAGILGVQSALASCQVTAVQVEHMGVALVHSEDNLSRKLGIGEKYHVLVVEDDAPTRSLLTRLLTLENFEVREAGNAGGILAAFQQPPLPDLVLLDVDLPDTNGFDVLRRIRDHRTLKHLPVVMLTGRNDPDDLAVGLKLGADGYITKPATLATLLAAVRTALK